MTNRENWRAINTEVNCCSIPSEIVFCNNFYFDPILRFLQGQNYIKFHLLKWQILMSELQEFDDWYNIHSQFRFGQLLPIINDVLLQLLNVTVAVIYKKGLSLKFAKPRVANSLLTKNVIMIGYWNQIFECEVIYVHELDNSHKI